MEKRNLFEELLEGFEALKKERLEKEHSKENDAPIVPSAPSNPA